MIPQPLRAALALAPLFFLAPSAAAQSTPPNVCVIVIDDVGAGLLGCYDSYYQTLGRPSATPARTPAIDTLLAAQGVTFANAWSCPMCTPSRSAMLTGRFGFRTGQGTAILARENNANPGLENDVVLLPELLHAAPTPYTNAAVGKWHLASQYQTQWNPLHPLGFPAGRWFDRFAGTFFNLELAAGQPQFEAGYYVWSKHYASRVQLSIDPCGGASLPCDIDMDANVSVDDYPTVDTIDDALALVAELPEPWFLYVAAHAIHEPFHDVPAGIPTTQCAGYQPPPAPCSYPGLGPFQRKSRCMLEALDSELGRLLCTLDFGDTNVLLVGDNGHAKRVVVSPYSLQHAKNTVYQGGIEVPLIVRGPAVGAGVAGTTNSALVSSIDLFATVLELASAPQPATPCDSISLVPYLQGVTNSLRPTVYSEVFVPNFVPDGPFYDLPAGYFAKRHDQALRNQRYKLIRKWRRDHSTAEPVLMEELYDLLEGGPPDTNQVPPAPTSDWLETNDLLASGQPLPLEAEQALAELRAEFDAFYPTVVR